MSRGRFITFEGGEGGGKTTQIARLKAALEARGIVVLHTREPGGTEGAEEIRHLLVTGDPGRWDPVTEALLNFAGRRDHVERKIHPALTAGTWVLCDRFADSTRAYQGYGHGMDDDDIESLYRVAVGNLVPDLTLILDLPVEQGLHRAVHQRGGSEDRYERMDKDFHQRLRDGFLDIARRDPKRCTIIDASLEMDAVTKAIFKAVRDRLDLDLS
ncbi:dTMP kinase [Magnetospira sp. QH-2]|uniref:dTMP kinase n=1 Tax=Magnetospira sp. (strain QH-2) TaxID=1288970 RepID=UPI0003E8197E|nr:dTMP kinase [Magnetospira sp. QH-2]CCQ73783.1 Thymidylate kinase [Magnetospira sp. QH-2]